MDVSVAGQTEAAALRARDGLGESPIATGRPHERTAASLARTALFEETLLNAIHARLAELKAATR